MNNIFTPSFDRRVRTFLVVLCCSLLGGTSFALYALWPANAEEGYAPTQPLAFSHRLHAGELKIECLYCHSGADKGALASVPSLATCMKCHTEVQSKNSKGKVKPDTALLLSHWEKGLPLAWNKVHDLGDFVYFDHSRHVRRFDPEKGIMVERISCQECHGPVEKMEVMRRHNALKMGWCLDCHKEPRQADTSPGLKTRGPINCSACHR